MITDMRDDFYEAILRRSVSFFQKHTTGTLLSALVNDIERVQYAMSSVLSDFLQQAFTLFCMVAVVVIRSAASWPGCCWSFCRSSP
jgi:ATP-binding cassette, subfamily B, bacterial MsbA